MSAAQVLKAGGLVPTDAKLGKDDAVDTVVARAYRHPVLPGRTIVRLTAQSVVAGDDLEMTTLGFGAGEDRGAVAKERKRPLGFPGWALVHDPKNARYALDVVKEFKKHARKAKSKPGHAKDGIDAIAKVLGKTVPHFLPSFYEEAGRAFIEHGSQSYAAAMFGKAREAEAVHALEVDEDHRVVAFLEFALAGAVTTKALAEYAKELGEHHEPIVAYAHFRQLCLQRTLGGMPPWAGMAKDLRRLAKAAKLDADVEDAKLVEEIIESPALAKAAGEFWRAYAEPITALAKGKPAARTAVLNLFPTGTTYSADLDDAWLDLLESTGAVTALVGDDPECQPSGGRAAWFDKLTQHLARSWRNSKISDRAFALLRRMAPKLVADCKPIACTARWHQLDLDLAELALELGVPVAPPEHARIDVDDWAQRAGDADRGRDPVRCAAHAQLGPLLGASVASQIGNEPFDTRSHGKAGFVDAKRGWLADVLARAGRAGMPGVQDALELVKTKVKAETFAELPELHAQFAALDVAQALARSLRVGILDEFGWPALEAAAAELNVDGKTALSIHGGLPAVIVATATRAIAVGPAGRLGTHDLVLPPKSELVTLRFIGGQFLVAIKDGWKVRCYWSGAPHDLFDTEASHWHVPTFANRCAVLGDGAWQEGAKPIRVGDRVAPGGNLSSHDGTTAWIAEWKDGRHLLREVSVTGEPGRTSWPAFLEAGLDSEWHLDGTLSYVLPVPAGITTSPLGLKDGMAGVRIRYQGANQHTQTARQLVTIDGRAWAGPLDVKACDLVILPSGDERPVVEDTQWRVGTTATILDREGLVRGSKIAAASPHYWRGAVAPYPTAMWHVLAARDAAGSARLRAIGDGEARALMSTLANGELAGLPEVTHARLRRGVAGLVQLAVDCEKLRDELRTERAPGKATARPTGAATIDDEVLLTALGGWCERRYGQGSALAQIARVGAFFRDDDRSDRSVAEALGTRLHWAPLALAPGALAFLATAIGSGVHRKTLLAVLDAIARELPDPAKLRVSGVTTADPNDAELEHALVLRWRGGNAYALVKHGWGNNYHVLEYAPDGNFKALAQLVYASEQRGRAAVAVCDLEVVTGAVAAGTTSWRDDVADTIAAATGLTPSEASYLWAGCPNASDHNVSFLEKELREQLGLKATQAALARDLLNAVPLAKRLAVLDEVGVGALAPDGAAKLAAAWVRVVGKRIAIPEELISDADREIKAPFPPGIALAMIGNASEALRLHTDAAWGLDPKGELVPVGSATPLVGQTKQEGDRQDFEASTMATVCAYLPFLYAELAVGDPLRAQAPIAYELALARLKNPSLYFTIGNNHVAADGRAGFESLLGSLGGDEIPGLGAGVSGRVVRGGILIRQTWTAGTPPVDYLQWKLHLHPATYDAKAEATLGPLAEQVHAWGYAPRKCLAFLRSEDLAAMMARIRDTPVPEGGWEQNPVASAPKLVDKMAKHHDLSKDAAALYLQYLVLLWPIAKNLLAWNGWKPKQLEAAQAELEKAELILEAKRERAGRTYFLPGGWEALKSPHPPFETWKLPMYGTRTTEGGPSPTMMRYVANAPFHLLFERAWKRIERGDVPKYDEVKR